MVLFTVTEKHGRDGRTWALHKMAGIFVFDDDHEGHDHDDHDEL